MDARKRLRIHKRNAGRVTRSDEGRLARPGLKTHYEVLGVSRFASQHELRAAYVELMKRHHPDRHLGQSWDVNNAQSIIRSYGVLKDAAGRFKYDMLISKDRRALIVPQPASKKSRAFVFSEPVALLSFGLLAIVAAGLYLAQAAPVETLEPDSFTGISAPVQLVNPEMPMPQEDEDTFAQTRAAITASEPAAIATSANCFATAREVGGPTAADRCVIFDTAYSYWHQNDANAPQIAPYFQTAALEERAIMALAGLGADRATTRIDALRSITFAALLRQVTMWPTSLFPPPSARTPPSALPAPRLAAKDRVAPPHQPGKINPAPK